METVEKIIIRLLLVQFILLVAAQLVFHKNNMFPEWKVIVQYEGVAKNQSGVCDVLNKQGNGAPEY